MTRTAAAAAELTALRVAETRAQDAARDAAAVVADHYTGAARLSRSDLAAAKARRAAAELAWDEALSRLNDARYA